MSAPRVEIEEQERLVADIQTRNNRLGDAFQNIGEILHVYSGGKIAMPKQEDLPGIADLQKVREALAELSSARQRLAELQQRKEAK